jgi:hypothetical protein
MVLVTQILDGHDILMHIQLVFSLFDSVEGLVAFKWLLQL